MRSRWIPLTILSAAAILLGAGLYSLSVGEHREETFTLTGAGDVQQLIGGIPQLGDRLGNSDAPITMDVFTDVMCPSCAQYQLDVVDPLIVKYVRTGEAQMNLRHYPVGVKPVTLGGVAAAAAGQQDHEWQYAEVFFRNLGSVPEQGVTQEFLNEVASVVPQLDVVGWADAQNSDEAEASANAGNDLATQLKIPAGPAIVVTGPGGSEQLDSYPSLEDVEAAIARVS